MKRIAMLLMVLGMFTFTFGCQTSVEDEREDVREAQQDAAEEVHEEQVETEEAAQEGAMEVQEEQEELREAELEETEPAVNP